MNLIPSLLLLNKHKQLWLWPSCTNHHPKTPSFRATSDDHRLLFMTHHKDSLAEPEVDLTTLGSFFTNSSESASISTDSDCSAVETIVRGARSERLFFEPDPTSSILETQGSSASEIGGGVGLPYKESAAIVMESENPYVDFKNSMAEMVEIHGLKDWDRLEELLGWYLRINAQNNHKFIVEAFLDLLAGFFGGGGGDGGGGGGVSCRGHSTASFTSAASTFSSPISSPLSHGN